MNKIAKQIKLVSIEEELKKSYLDYAMSVIIGRALPDVRDGLKPVHRRILFAMKILGNNWNQAYKKSARIVGDVIGKFHPHGDTAVYDSIVRMAQPFSLRYMLIDGQGNFGSIDGDSAAAMRYTEIRMSKIAHELLIDIDKDTVDYVYNYDNTEQIPDVMPTRIPNLLINGSSGIAVGMATNIPPHNISEIIDGCLAYIDNEDISIEDLMKYIPGPDFPTYAIIHGTAGIKEAYKTGRGKIYLRARAKVETDYKNNRDVIVITEIPYQVNKSKLIEKIANLIKEKIIDGIVGLRDESDQDGMRIVIEIKKDVIGKVVLKNLYSLTQMQISFGINMVALCKNQPKLLSLKEILSEFIHHRCEVVIRRTNFELKKSKERISILKALFIATTNSNLIINLIRRSSNSTEAKYLLMENPWNDCNIVFPLGNSLEDIKKSPNLNDKNFVKKYYLNTQQAQAILEMKLEKLTNSESYKIIDEYKKLLKKIDSLDLILKNHDHLMKVVRSELLLIREEYKDKRRTEIIDDSSDINIEDLINKEDVVVTLSYKGYVKYQPIADYEAQHRGGKGKSITNTKEEDLVYRILVANTHDTILLFSSRGRMYWMKVYQLPEAGRNHCGKPIINLLPLDSNERITAILPLRRHEEKCYIFMATSSGIVKKTSILEFGKPRNSGIIAINLNEDDNLIGVDLTNGNDEIMLFSSYGKVVRFSEKQIRSVKRNATGVKGINLIDDDQVVSLIVTNGDGSILTVTKNGYGKRTNKLEYPVKSRATKGVISIKVSKRNGKVVGAVQVNDDDQVMMITNAGTLVRIRVSEINIVSRNTNGVMLIRISKGENVVGLQRVINSITNSRY